MRKAKYASYLLFFIKLFYLFHSTFLLQVTPEELKVLISKYGDTDKLASSGVTIAGTRYMYLSSTDRVVRAKKGTNGVHAIKTQQSKPPVVNFINILRAAFFHIFFCQKHHKAELYVEKS